MNKIQTFDFHLGAIDISGNSTTGFIDLGSCRNAGRFSVQSIMTAGSESVLGAAEDWTEDGVTEGLWTRAWDGTVYGEPSSVYFNTTEAGTSDSTPDAEYEWYWVGDVLSVFTAAHDGATAFNPATYYTEITAYVAPTIQLDYLASNDLINYVVGTAIGTGVTTGAKLPVAFTPPLCRRLKLKATEEGVGNIASLRLILAVQ